MGRARKCKKIRIDADSYKSAIVAKYKNLSRANVIMERGHDYLHNQFFRFSVNFPIDLLEEVKEKLGIDYEPFRKLNKPDDKEESIFDFLEETNESPDAVWETLEHQHDFEKDLRDKFVQIGILYSEAIAMIIREVKG